MLRRNVNNSSLQPQQRNTDKSLRSRVMSGRKMDFQGSPFCSIWFLTLVAVVLTMAIWLFPDEVAYAEREAVREAQLMEEGIADWWAGGDTNAAAPEPKNEATKRMLAQSSKWVDGEKKLKKMLKELAERQKDGKDIGVPVLTRYLGDDIPAWPKDGLSTEEWQKKVDQRYADMRKEEEQWKERIAALLREENVG